LEGGNGLDDGDSKGKNNLVTIGRRICTSFLPRSFFSRFTVRIMRPHVWALSLAWCDDRQHLAGAIIERVASVRLNKVLREARMVFMLEILPVSNRLQLLGRAPSWLLPDLYTSIALLQNDLIDVLKSSRFDRQMEIDVLCTHCLSNRLPPLSCEVFSYEDLSRVIEDAGCETTVTSEGGRCTVRVGNLLPSALVLSDTVVIPMKELEFLENIGSGGYSNVWKARYREELVAVKQYNSSGRGNLHELTKELLMCSNLSGAHIVQTLGVVMDPTEGKYCLVMEALSCGLDRIVYNPVMFPLLWRDRLRILQHIAEGVLTVHKAGLIHRDLKSSNVLLRVTAQADGTLSVVAKVTDFNMSCVVVDATSMQVWPPYFLAPEAMMGSGCCFLVDIYSFGVIMYETVARKLLFQDMVTKSYEESLVYDAVIQGKRPQIVNNAIVEPHIDEEIMESFAAIVSACWHQWPSSRPHFPEIICELETLDLKRAALGKQWKMSKTKSPRAMPDMYAWATLDNLTSAPP